MESKLPLNIPHLLRIGWPDCNYLLRGRQYSDLEWIDPKPKPTIEDLEAVHLRLLDQAKNHTDWVAEHVNNATRSNHAVKREAEIAAAPLVRQAQEENDLRRAELAKEFIEAKLAIQAEKTKKEAEECWLEVDKYRKRSMEDALAYLHETDWFVLRSHETGKEIPEDVKQKRQLARESIEKGELVYKNWHKLRESNYPTRQEMAEALRSGSLEAVRMIARISAVNQTFRKPSR